MKTLTLIDSYKVTGTYDLVEKDGGSVWIPFEVDTLAEQEPGQCAICGAETMSGYMNMDCAGEEVCSSHVTIEEAR